MALKSEVWDYIAKPARIDEIRLPMLRALEYRRQKRKKQPLAIKRQAIVGKSPRLTAAMEAMALAAGSSANVLITGETGTKRSAA